MSAVQSIIEYVVNYLQTTLVTFDDLTDTYLDNSFKIEGLSFFDGFVPKGTKVPFVNINEMANVGDGGFNYTTIKDEYIIVLELDIYFDKELGREFHRRIADRIFNLLHQKHFTITNTADCWSEGITPGIIIYAGGFLNVISQQFSFKGTLA